MNPRDLPPLNALRAFEAAARLQSVSQAALELHVTHGAVSRQIRALEEQLGQPLFVREGRGVRLTPAGVQLREVAGEAFGRLREGWGALLEQGRARPFVLGCPGSLLARWLIPRLDRLQRELPELGLQLVASEGGPGDNPALDGGLGFFAAPWPTGVQVVELAEERIGPVLSPRLPLFAALQKDGPARLLQEPLLHTASRPQAWPQWVQAQQLDPARLRLGQGFEHLYYLLEAAVAGLGVAIAPHLLVADDLVAGRLAAPLGFVATGAQLALWLPRHGDPRGQQLAAWLQAELA